MKKIFSLIAIVGLSFAVGCDDGKKGSGSGSGSKTPAGSGTPAGGPSASGTGSK